MENKKTTEILPEGSEKKMNEDTCKHEELRNYPDLCVVAQVCYEDNKGSINECDVRFLVHSVLCEVSESIPSHDEEKMFFIVELIEEFLCGGYYDIDPLLWIFKKILIEHVKDEELIQACSFQLNLAREASREW